MLLQASQLALTSRGCFPVSSSKIVWILLRMYGVDEEQGSDFAILPEKIERLP